MTFGRTSDHIFGVMFEPASQKRQASLRASKPVNQTARLPASQTTSWLFSACVLVAMNILTPQRLAHMRPKVWQTRGPNVDRNVCQHGFNWSNAYDTEYFMTRANFIALSSPSRRQTPSLYFKPIELSQLHVSFQRRMWHLQSALEELDSD
jgi:hypothetical protein